MRTDAEYQSNVVFVGPDQGMHLGFSGVRALRMVGITPIQPHCELSAIAGGMDPAWACQWGHHQ